MAYSLIQSGDVKMKLKTLKDLNWANQEPQRTQLRQEAIKWVKADMEEYRHSKIKVSQEVHNFIVQRRQFWKDRFNITEEDLK